MDDKLTRIKEATLSLFKEKGYKETKISDISEKSGIAIGTIYKYFKNKKELFDSVNQPELFDVRPSYETARYKILLKASRVFAEYGYKDTSMDSIASVCRFSKASLYKYFKSKEELFVAIIQETGTIIDFKGILDRAIDSEEDMESVLTKVGLEYFKMLGEPHRVNIMKMKIAESKRFPEVGQALINKHIAIANEELAKYFDALKKQGLISCNDTRFIAKMFFENLLSYIIIERIIKQENEVAYEKEFVKRVINIFINGIRHSKV